MFAGTLSWQCADDRDSGGPLRRGRQMTFQELIRLLEANGFKLVRQKGSVR
jgi:hypothetical protein